LRIDNDSFVLSFVNVVFKQSILNSELALLFAMLCLSAQIALKKVPYGTKIKTLFSERCTESFLGPKSDTEKGTIRLLRGAVTFARRLLRDEIVGISLLHVWSDYFLQSGSTVSAGLLMALLTACGNSLLQRMDNVTEPELANPYMSLREIVDESLPPDE
jgi:hypothetical protein